MLTTLQEKAMLYLLLKIFCQLFAWQKKDNLNLATGKSTGYARRRSYRCINILQGFGNKADSVELQVPKGRKYEKIILMECDL
jgi:hypothetical protein